MANTLFYLNSAFDNEIGTYDVSIYSPIIHELEMNYIILSGPDDIVLTYCSPGLEYFGYLEKRGIYETGKIISPDNWCKVNGSALDSTLSSVKNYRIWGINRQVLETLHLSEDKFPPTDVVSELNSREFCHYLKKTLFPEHESRICYGIEGLKREMESTEKFPVIIKSFFGSAGTGFLLKEGKEFTAREITRLGGYINEKSKGFVIEPWRKRVSDFSCGMELENDGSVSMICFNVLTNSVKGIFRSVTVTGDFSLGSLAVGKEAASLAEKTIMSVGKAASEMGYYGYAGIDGYLYSDGERICTETLSEINARNTMAKYALDLKHKYSNAKYARLVISRFAAENISTYDDLENRLGDLNFTADLGEGILLCNPLSYSFDSGENRSRYLNFVMFADTVESLEKYSAAVAAIETSFPR